MWEIALKLFDLLLHSKWKKKNSFQNCISVRYIWLLLLLLLFCFYASSFYFFSLWLTLLWMNKSIFALFEIILYCIHIVCMSECVSVLQTMLINKICLKWIVGKEEEEEETFRLRSKQLITSSTWLISTLNKQNYNNSIIRIASRLFEEWHSR